MREKLVLFVLSLLGKWGILSPFQGWIARQAITTKIEAPYETKSKPKSKTNLRHKNGKCNK